jgi:hypothetical protein
MGICNSSATVRPADPALCQSLIDIVKNRLEQFRGSIANVDEVLGAVTSQIMESKESKNEEGYIDLKFDNLQVMIRSKYDLKNVCHQLNAFSTPTSPVFKFSSVLHNAIPLLN